MELYYSPHFDGSTYVDDAGCRMGFKIVESIGLLEELERRVGIHISVNYDTLDKERAEAYKEILSENPKIKLSDDFAISQAKEYLRWRDALIMQGWDGNVTGVGKVDNAIHAVEAKAKANPTVALGLADRWRRLATLGYKSLQKTRLCAFLKNNTIHVHCPQELVPPIILDVIQSENTTFLDVSNANIANVSNVETWHFSEFREGLEFLAKDMEPVKDQMVACADKTRFSSVLTAFGKPTVEPAQKGCYSCPRDVRSMVSCPKHLVWLGCQNDYSPKDPLKFLSVSEKNVVMNANTSISIPDVKSILQTAENHIVYALSQAEKVTIVSAQYDEAVLLPESPIVAKLKQRGVMPMSKYVSYSTLPVENVVQLRPQTYFELKDGDSKVDALVRTFEESQSTIEALIQHPFDYVVERMCGLYEPFQDESLPIVKGNVAHKMMELMVQDCNESLDSLKGLYANKFDEYLTAAITFSTNGSHPLGELLQQAQNTFELYEFKETIRESVGVLLGILKDENLTPIKCEFVAHGNYNGIGDMKGSVDFVLLNASGEYVIIDFKYSKNNKYKDLLAQNRSVQFEVYTKILAQSLSKDADSKVVAYGYYQFPLKKLYTQGGFSSGNENIEIVASATDNRIADLQKSLIASVSFRRQELKNGKVEAGEGMPLDVLDYHVTQQGALTSSATELLPLDADKKTKDAQYLNHNALRNMLK